MKPEQKINEQIPIEQESTESESHEQIIGEQIDKELQDEASCVAQSPSAIPGLEVILASASPRRKDLLDQAGVQCRVYVCEVDETLDDDVLSDPEEATKKLAEKKAGAVVQEILGHNYEGCAVVIGADTMVVLDDEVFGKPKNLSDAKRMLRCLSGKTHRVITGTSVWMVAAPQAEQVSLGFRTFAETSFVSFKELSDDEIDEYLRAGESFDKAGSYAVQGKGKDLIEKIEGDIDTVIGLPVKKLLKEFPDLI